MFGLIDISFANEFLSKVIEGQQWADFSDEEKMRALNSACMQISKKIYKKNYFEDPSIMPVEMKYAICLQALYLLIDDEKMDTVISEKNGDLSTEVKLGDVTTKTTKKTKNSSKELYAPVESMLKPFLLSVTRFK